MEFFEDGRLELYNLREDVGETNDRAADMPELTRELHAQLKAWQEAIGAPMPTPHTPGERPTSSAP